MPLMLLFALGIVVAERLRVGSRMTYAVLAAALLIAVTLAGVGGTRLAGQAKGAPDPTVLALALANTSGDSGTNSNADPHPPTPPTVVLAVTPPSTIAPATVAPPTVTAAPSATQTQVAPTATASATTPSRQTNQARLAVEYVPPTATAVPPTPTPVPVTPPGTTVIPILMYHYVRVVTDPKDTIGINLSVKPDLFAAQMQYLADNGYTTLTMADVYAILAGQQPLPPRPIALTFDDGYRDFYTAAWPVLAKHGFKATNYVITDFIGWNAYMTWDMLKELNASGLVEIGAHTLDHGDLRAMNNDRRWKEIAGSKAALEQGLGRPVTAFCYPAGKYDAAVAGLVKQAGYLTATTVEYGTKQNLQWAFELPRVRVNGPDTLPVWIGKLPK